MAITTLDISLPEAYKAYVDGLVEAGKYATFSDYICELIRAERQKRRDEYMQKMLQEGLDSGAPIEIKDAYWEAKLQGLDDEIISSVSIMPKNRSRRWCRHGCFDQEGNR